MRRNYVRPRVAVVSVNGEGLCIVASGFLFGCDRCPGDPVMGTDDPNSNYWEL